MGFSGTLSRMLIIRLQRVGRIHEPVFRLVLTDSRNAAKSGKFLEVLGSYDPRVNKPQLDSERILLHVKNGAQLSDTVHNLLISAGVITGKKINVLPKKTVAKTESSAEVLAAPSAEASAPEASPVETPAV